MKPLRQLFTEFFRISLFVIGGGYSILVVADRRFAKLGWTRDGEIIDHLPVFQTVPGLIATHTAVYVGRKMAGKPGALVGVLAVAIPAILIFTGVSICYKMIPLGNPWLDSSFIGLRAALTGIIAATIIKSWRKSLPDAFAYALMIAGVLAIGYFHMHVALVLVLAMTLGLSTTIRSSPSPSHFAFSILPLLLFAQYGALCFGGGFVIVPMYLNDFIGESAPYLQIAEGEFGDIMALSQMTPGPIGVNCATFFGYRLAGFAGALIASVLLLLPGSVLAYAALSSLEKFKTSNIVKGIMRGIRPASIALMLVALLAFAKMTVGCDGAFHLWGLVLTIIATVLTMNKKINVILLIVLCALTASVVRADDLHLDEITTRAFPDADAVTVDEREEVEYFADGTEKSVEESWVKALTERGRRELSTDTHWYSQRYGTGRFAEVAIISPDGTKRVLDLKDLVKESTDNSMSSANIYDPMDRVIECNIPGVKVGDTVYVRKESSTFSPRCQDAWAKQSVMEWFSPILRHSLRVKCPKDRPIRSVAIRHPLGNIVSSALTNADGSVVMEWCATNSPQAFYEPSMPSPRKQLQHVIVSTHADWRELSKWYWDLCAPHLAKTNAAMVAKVADLIRTARDSRAGLPEHRNPSALARDDESDRLLKSIFKFVSQEIRYMGLTMEDKSPGYAPHDVDITFDKRYGVCRDKAGLLAAMLRLAGFKAFPVLIMAGSAKVDKDVPTPYFNHAIVAVDISKDERLRNSSFITHHSSLSRYILMDPTAESTRDLLPSYESDCSYLVARPEGEVLDTTPMPPADDNLLKYDTQATLAGDGSMLLEIRMDFLGVNDNIYRGWFVRLTKTELRQTLEGLASRTYPGAQLLKYEVQPEDLRDVSKPLTVKMSAKVPAALLRGETELRLMTGWLSKNLTAPNLVLNGKTALEKRRFPLRLRSTAGAEETLRIELGGAVGAAKSIPEKLDIEGLYEYHLSAEVTNGVYALSRKLKVNSLEFSPEEYLALRENIKSVEAAERRYSSFGKNRFANSNLHYLLREESVDFTGGHSWVETNLVVKKVLTYDGKKENSEFILEYNPLVETVKVLRASVTGADGRTACIGEKEITELDCDWAASAPRYPASRQLVVTLPSVEIGSVVTTLVESVTTGSPCAFRRRFYTDAVEPTDELVYRVGGDERKLVDPERIPREDHQPEGRKWRQNFVVDRGTFAATCEFLRQAATVEKLDPSILGLDLGPRPAPKALRDWMIKHVRIAGPSLYEVPLERQLTDPATVVKDRYATRLDYIRTLCALLKGAGYAADIVFASSLRGGDERYPNAYTKAVCRVDGCFLGLENEYNPLEATSHDGDWYLDPATGKEDVIRAKTDAMRPAEEDRTVITVRPNGAVDWDVDRRFYGSEVGRFRKYYAEMLPEYRSRHYQMLVAGIAQSASATSELVTDTESYPARLACSCFVPDYAVVEGDMISLAISSLSGDRRVAGEVRRSPYEVERSIRKTATWRVVFPEGYTEIEKLPAEVAIHDPLDPAKVWRKIAVKTEVKDGHLEVLVTRRVFEREDTAVPGDYFPMLRDWARRTSGPDASTIVVRR